MGSPFKMKPKSPMMKALVGKQSNLPQHLKEKILAAPESPAKMAHKSPAKSYGSKSKSPVMKKKNPYGDVVLDTKTEKKDRKKDRGKNIVTTETVEKGMSASRRAKLEKAISQGKGGEEMTKAQREGYNRIGTKTYVRQEGTGAKGSKGYMAGSTIAGTKTNPKTGKTMKRKLADGSSVVVEGSVGKIKKRGLATPKPKARTLKGTASAIKPRKATAGKPSASTEELKKKKTSPFQKKGVKALEAQRGTKNPSPIKKHGSKKSPVMQQDLKKKDTKGKTKLPKLVVNTPKGPKAPRGPQRGSIGGVNVSIQTKGRSTKNTDLLEVGKKYYKKAKKYVKSKMN